MREMSRFSCPINVCSDGVCKKLKSLRIHTHHINIVSGKVKDSTEIVPGDVVSLAQPALTVFPADMFLLSGDAIVNESMLTGESVPISKSPIKDVDLLKWRESLAVSTEIAKALLYAGTRVVRVRGAMATDGSTSGPALALVIRTGLIISETNSFWGANVIN